MSAGALLAAVAVLAFGATALLTPFVRRAALGGGLVAQARRDRWHTVPTPVLGGVAIFIGFVIALFFGFFWSPPLPSVTRMVLGGRIPWSGLDGLVLAAVAMFVTGVVDDVRPMRPLTKLLLQVMAASILVFSGVMLRLFGVPALDVPLSVVWFVGITNALNLLDNMDGLAGGIAAIAAFYLGVIFVWDGLTPFAVVAFALFGALAGFLVHNYPPAKIFMGDGGSLFLGIVLSGLALSPAPGLSRGLFAVLVLPASILAIPILDTTLVTAGRIAEGRPISQGGRDHTSHRIVALGVPGDRAVWILWTLAAASGGVGLLFRTSERAYAYLLGGIVFVLLALLGTYFLGLDLRERIASGREAGTLFERFLLWHRHWPVLTIGLDLALVTVAYYGAYLLRWDASELPPQLEYFRRSLPLVVPLKLAALVAGGVYRRSWRYFGVSDVGSVVRANVVGSMVTFGLLILVTGFGFSRGVLVIDFLLATTLILAARFSIRIFEGVGRRLSRTGRRTVIVASERDAQFLINELEEHEEYGLRPVAVAERRGTRGVLALRGYDFFHGPDALERAVSRTGADVVLTVRRGGSWPRGTGDLAGECEFLGVELRIVELQVVGPGPAPATADLAADTADPTPSA